jgi:hypothetical protein
MSSKDTAQNTGDDGRKYVIIGVCLGVAVLAALLAVLVYLRLRKQSKARSVVAPVPLQTVSVPRMDASTGSLTSLHHQTQETKAQ